MELFKLRIYDRIHIILQECSMYDYQYINILKNSYRANISVKYLEEKLRQSFSYYKCIQLATTMQSASSDSGHKMDREIHYSLKNPRKTNL